MARRDQAMGGDFILQAGGGVEFSRVVVGSRGEYRAARLLLRNLDSVSTVWVYSKKRMFLTIVI